MEEDIKSIVDRLDRIETNISPENENLVRKQAKDAIGILKEEILKNLFASSLAETVTEIVKVVLEASMLFLTTHAIVFIVVIVAASLIGVYAALKMRGKHHGK
jgi:hypothetical protein